MELPSVSPISFQIDIPQPHRSSVNSKCSPTLGYGTMPHPLTASSTTLVNVPLTGKRPSIKLKFSSRGSAVVNSVVVDPSGRPLYSVSSDWKRTVLASCQDNVDVADIEWDRASPRMVFRHRQMKCRDWLPLAGSETDNCRLLTHGDAQLKWTNRSTSGYLIPAGRPGLAQARWRIRAHTDDLHLEIFQEALVEQGLLEAIILSLVLLQSGRPLGDVALHRYPLLFSGYT
ncbi:hypothetical protein BJV74DRAFT_858037 [Russula compacta]|nr:hypothetical protein BJV74DRAFT_858037 [Russula compacta]